MKYTIDLIKNLQLVIASSVDFPAIFIHSAQALLDAEKQNYW